jgi:PD-(D/E)XK nuclease superfamily
MTIDEAVEQFHWIKVAEDGAIELFLDHHALSTFRMCEAHFELSHLGKYGGRGRRPWPLAFGIVFHKAVEYLYQSKAIDVFNPDKLVRVASGMWDEAGLDYYKEHKTYQALCGKAGFIALILQYTSFYSGESERLRPIATEVAFGKSREVPLGEFDFILNEHNVTVPHSRVIKVRCFLTGRIDFLMDSGTAIGPMDHKTSAFFKGDPLANYEPQEGMTGYVYATQYIIQKNFPELAAKRKLDRMWMNFIQVKNEPDNNKRFKRIPLFKTDWQLEQYRLRQLSTFRNLLDLTISGRAADWNTSVCNNYWHQPCQFKNVHRQGSAASQLLILNQDFEVQPEWNPETVED